MAGKVYLINLDRHPERLAHMQAQLAGIAFERIAAVDGADDPEMTDGLTRFERACLASHRNAWRLFLASANEHAYFLEDDLHIRPDLAALVCDESWIPRDAHSVKLDTYFQKVKLGDGTRVLRDRVVAALHTRHQSSAAYALSRMGAARYLALTETPVLPADYCLFPKNPRKLGLRVYQLTPAVAVQDHLLRAEDGGRAFPTTMGSGEPLQARRLSILDKIRREGRRLASQPADIKEAIVLRTLLSLETTTVGVR